MLCLPLPDFVIKKINSICRSFIWTGKATNSRKSPVAWHHVCKPVKQGGLNILNLQVWNSVALMKSLWNICMKVDNLWVKWVHTYYLKGRNYDAEINTNNCTWILKCIMTKIQDISGVQHLWNSMIAQAKFQMMKVYSMLMGDDSRIDWYHLMSHNFARPRAKVIMWLAIQDRLPTKMRLHRLGLLQDTTCALCGVAEESVDHILFHCSHTVRLWDRLLEWLDKQTAGTMNFNWIKRVTKGKGQNKGMLKATLTEVVYGIWMHRNKRIFDTVMDNMDIQCMARDIIDTLVYRRWQKPNYRKIIVNTLM
ncbi:uncharacterized protein LOC131597539 [Vicia villosa]|uniref:uncharacterized protein LOC131597539 n=1 Tax=Vicia villosa TaxID=3911 RepID=UPI00273B18B5|nr:uncharacterized protein LOC131597539 [Vicia villosa]